MFRLGTNKVLKRSFCFKSTEFHNYVLSLNDPSQETKRLNLQHQCLKPLLLSSLNDISKFKQENQLLNVIDIGFGSASVIHQIFKYYETTNPINIFGIENNQTLIDYVCDNDMFLRNKMEDNRLKLYNIDISEDNSISKLMELSNITNGFDIIIMRLIAQHLPSIKLKSIIFNIINNLLSNNNGNIIIQDGLFIESNYGFYINPINELYNLKKWLNEFMSNNGYFRGIMDYNTPIKLSSIMDEYKNDNANFSYYENDLLYGGKYGTNAYNALVMSIEALIKASLAHGQITEEMSTNILKDVYQFKQIKYGRIYQVITCITGTKSENVL